MKPSSPYVGPRTFTENERNRFYGRSRELEDLIHLLLAERIILLHSPSGAGKSSLLQAGLIPQLKELGFVTKGPLRANDLAHFPWEEFSKDPHGEVLIFDQFEETVTVDPFNVEAKNSFFQQLGQALRNRERWAVFAIREDYLAALDPYLNFIPTRLSNTFRLNLLGEKGAKDAICLPAKDAGIPFTKEASETLFDDLRTIQLQLPDASKAVAKGEFVEPVQLQVVCDRIWRDLPENAREIGVENIHARKENDEGDAARRDQSTQKDSLSEVDRALADFYSVTVSNVAKLPEVASQGTTERALRDWFEQHLITHQGIRSQVLRSEGLGDRVSEELDKAHIVRSETRSNREFLELAHDRLVQPVLASNREWRDANLSPFQQEAAKWAENNVRSDDRLLRGTTLQEAETWAVANKTRLTQDEHDFLAACQRARRALQRVRLFAVAVVVLLIVAAISAVEFYREKQSYMKALRASRQVSNQIVFQIDDRLEQLPNSGPIRKKLLGAAIGLNLKLGMSGEGGYGAAQTTFWGQYLQGKLAELNEDREKAKLHYRGALQSAADLAQAFPKDLDARHLRSLSLAALGDIRKKEGDESDKKKDAPNSKASWKEASELYLQALPIAQELVQRDPKNRVWRFDLYFLDKALGDTIEANETARDYYLQAIKESTRLADEEPTDTKAQEVLWQSLTDMGDWYKNSGYDLNAAVEQYANALAIAEKLSRVKPPDRHFQHILWASYMTLGDVAGNIDEKRVWYEKAQNLAKSLVQQDLSSRESSGSPAQKDLDDTNTALGQLNPTPKR